MALNAALVDRGRRIVDTPLVTKVEGSTQFTTVTGAWFRCRVTPQGTPEADDSQGGRRKVALVATLLTGKKDLNGQLLTFLPTDKIETNSKALGDYVWNITDEPAPIRKKRKVIGWTVALVRVVESEFVPARP